MISRVLYAIERSFVYLKKHPQIILILALLLVMPLLFLYSGQQFLDAGRENQDRLQKDRIGLMQDVFVSLILASDFDTDVLQTEIERVASLNPDIADFKITKKVGREIVPVASLDGQLEMISTESAQFYRDATVRLDESIIFELQTEDGRMWYTYRALENESGELYFVFTQLSLQSIDALFVAKERSAMFSLVFIYLFVVALAYWHIKLTDYRYLYLEVQKATEMKDLFTNMIAHELRAPLTAIRGYASMIEEQARDTEEMKYAQRIKDSSERLLDIVNDLLDVARIQSGKLSVEPTEVDISETITHVLDELRVSGSEKNITLQQIGTESPHLVTADAKRLHQAFTNLVSNAIKYTKEGSIELSVEEKRKTIEVRVKDTGMGISSEDQQKLFAPFFRVSNTNVSKITGTGLGMWITKQLIELMGAKITVESIKGVGTHVVITLSKPVQK